MEEILSGTADWPVGTVQNLVQMDLRMGLFGDEYCPPAVEGKRYLLLSFRSPDEEDYTSRLRSPWFAHPRGILVVRGQEEFVFSRGICYSISSIREWVKSGKVVPLEDFENPLKQLQVAESRLEKGNIGPTDSFVRPLVANIADPEVRAQLAADLLESSTNTDYFGFEGPEDPTPHSIWLKSLVLLRNLGRVGEHRGVVAKALQPHVRHKHITVGLAVAYTLAELGNDAGKEALIEGYREELGSLHHFPGSDEFFPSRFRYGDSSITASAYALALIGDRRGLSHEDPEVRLVTVDALLDKEGHDLALVLHPIAEECDDEVEELERTGVLDAPRDRSDRKGRYPDRWIKAHNQLAYLGNNESLRILVDAWLRDMDTYPKEDSLVPQPIPVVSDCSTLGWPSLQRAVLSSATTPEVLLARLEAVFSEDSRWNGKHFKRLRSALEPESPEESETTSVPVQGPGADVEILPKINDLLSSDDPEKRAEGIAAIGHHGVCSLLDRVLTEALEGEGIEQRAALYSLRKYTEEIPKEDLRGLLTANDLSVRLTGLQVSTRRDPERFAGEAIHIAKDLVSFHFNGDAGGEDDPAFEIPPDYVAQILSRLPRAGIPEAMIAALKDTDPQFREVVVQSLGLSGNPDAASHISKRPANPTF